MKINIVLPLKDNWIFEDIANNLKKNIKKKNLKVEISKKPIKGYDVYHHISYLNCNHKTLFQEKVNTSMITHVDTINKLKIIIKLNSHIDCFTVQSFQTKKYINKFLDKIKTKVIYVPPNEKVSLNKIKLGIFSNKYSDGRKNEKVLINTLKKLNPNIFEIFIMGKNWEKEIKQIKNLNFTCYYEKNFNINRYKSILAKVDYLLYLGFDEGSISVMDALKSGTKLIVTNQGFHKDFFKFVDYKINNINNDLYTHLNKMQKNIFKKKIFMNQFNYENFTNNHLKLWKKISMNKKNYNKQSKMFKNDINLIINTINRKFNIFKNKII
tara:strand:+ start:534 stop:1508 length:975 start_codon:yes stop_codon:yes gene_type:complete